MFKSFTLAISNRFLTSFICKMRLKNYKWRHTVTRLNILNKIVHGVVTNLPDVKVLLFWFLNVWWRLININLVILYSYHTIYAHAQKILRRHSIEQQFLCNRKNWVDQIINFFHFTGNKRRAFLSETKGKRWKYSPK